MPAPIEPAHAGRTEGTAGKDEGLWLSITITRGPRFYGDRKHSTNLEIAEILEDYARRSPPGLLREVYTTLAKFHLKADEQVPGFAESATGSFPVTFNTNGCNTCPLPNGTQGQLVTSTVNGYTALPGDCYPCSPPSSK